MLARTTGPLRWPALAAPRQPRGYPAIDHSAAYEHAYQPAYRVLTRREFGGLKIPASER